MDFQAANLLEASLTWIDIRVCCVRFELFIMFYLSTYYVIGGNIAKILNCSTRELDTVTLDYRGTNVKKIYNYVIKI